MKSNLLFRLFLVLMAAATITMTGCQKDDPEPTPTDKTQSLQQLSKDDNNIQVISDEIQNDAMNVASGGNLKSTNKYWPCNATIDSTDVQGDTITYFITYNGLNCAETFYRTGQVIVKRPKGIPWISAGASVTVKQIDFRITKVATGESVTLNGKHVFTNVSGGNLWTLAFGISDVLIHRVEGYMNATFDDSTTHIWYIARERALTGPIDSLALTVNGFGSADGYNNLVTWGTNRNGEEFYGQINQSVVYKLICEGHPVSGIIHYEIPQDDKSATITYGYDSNNQPVTNGECPTKYRLDWEYNGNSGTFYLWL